MDGEELLITFKNAVAPGTENRIRELINYFESEETYHIFKLKTKGAFLVKDFLRQMNIRLKVSFTDHQFCFVLIIKTSL
jgi:hypothetical protein